jgi:SAM-dependent methyltransferase
MQRITPNCIWLSRPPDKAPSHSEKSCYNPITTYQQDYYMASDSNERAGWELIWRSGNIPPRYQSLAEPNATVVEWADTLPAGAYLLDVGCGVGRHLVYLGGRGFRVAGVDISPSGVRIAQEVCAEGQIPVDARVSDMNALPWVDNTFDGALSTSTIHHHLRAGIVETLGEIKRVLKPGGTLMADFLHTDTAHYQHIKAQVAAGELTEVEPNTFVDQRPNPNDMDDEFLPHHFSDESDLRDLLGEFEIIKLSADLHDSEHGKRGRWVVWVRKPLG